VPKKITHGKKIREAKRKKSGPGMKSFQTDSGGITIVRLTYKMETKGKGTGGGKERKPDFGVEKAQSTTGVCKCGEIAEKKGLREKRVESWTLEANAVATRKQGVDKQQP